MSFPINRRGRGCASSFPQPVSETDICRAQSLMDTIYHYNCVSPAIGCPRLEAIWYRNIMGEDILQHVFHWETTPYNQVFQNGLRARPKKFEDGQQIEDEYYFNLYDHVITDGIPPAPNSRRPRNHAFVSTTLNSAWHPNRCLNPGQSQEVYRYEIYAPGGIWVAQTLGKHYPQELRSQSEISFVLGIAPQYIRSAQLFILERKVGSMFTKARRVDNIIRVNGNFNPQYELPRLRIQKPIFDCRNEHQKSVPLTIYICGRQGLIDNTDWYANRVAGIETYIDAAFRSSRKNEAYVFMKNEYVCVNYAPGTTDDWIVTGPHLIRDGYPSLAGTAFGEYGVDAAFACHDGNKAFIFSGNLCAHIDYAPGTTNDKILNGPMTITAMFPFFKDTVFENGVAAAFESTATNKAYLFKGNKYALINYNCKSLIAIRTLTDGFPSLKNTIFEDGIDAAFASHRTDEAYLFKGDKYARINFAPDTTDDYIIGGVNSILQKWPSLRCMLPRKNRGLDLHP